MKMKLRLILLFLVLAAVLLSACGHEHTWQSATCTEAKKCTECGESEGEPLGHSWGNATCTEANICSGCGETKGEPLGHKWEEATCTAAKTCAVCGESEGSALGHEWEAATCTAAKTCSVCGETEGDKLEHTVAAWKTTKETSCSATGEEEGQCENCGETVKRSIEKLPHKKGDWFVYIAATENSDGIKAISCEVCSEILDSKTYKLSAEEIRELYMDSCSSISYDSLARNPDLYEGARIYFRGYVVQVCSEASSDLYYSTYRVATRGHYDNVIYVKIDNYGSGTRILEDDYIELYGTFDGLFSYKTVMGSQLTIPSMIAEYVS